MAYLIHANHWPLAQTYAFVTERRKGISPNIGFVGELMSFEEEELGGKSLGVVSSNPAGLAMNQENTPKFPDGSDASTTSSSLNNGGGRQAPNGDSWSGPGHGHSQSVVVGPSVLSGLAGMLPPGRRGAHHIRESLPPTFSHQPVSTSALFNSSGDLGANGEDGPGDGTSPNGPEVGDAMAHAQEVEVKDADGRYRHARRAPVDELTLQPMRRSSKAGLESSNWSMTSTTK